MKGNTACLLFASKTFPIVVEKLSAIVNKSKDIKIKISTRMFAKRTLPNCLFMIFMTKSAVCAQSYIHIPSTINTAEQSHLVR